MTRAFDEAELLQRVDNDWEFLGETVQMLSSDGPALLQEIARATEAGDAPAVGRVAHALKGMISNFCAPGAQAAALKLEQIGKSGDLSAAPQAVQALEGELRSLISELTDFVGQRT